MLRQVFCCENQVKPLGSNGFLDFKGARIWPKCLCCEPVYGLYGFVLPLAGTSVSTEGKPCIAVAWHCPPICGRYARYLEEHYARFEITIIAVNCLPLCLIYDINETVTYVTLCRYGGLFRGYQPGKTKKAGLCGSKILYRGSKAE